MGHNVEQTISLNEIDYTLLAGVPNTAFTEAMARALEVKLEDLGELSLQSTQAIPMNAQCTVFAESEVVTLLHCKTSKADMARAIHDAIADRITSMVRREG